MLQNIRLSTSAFDFDTGQYRLSTAVLHGLTIGTRVGTGMNDTNVVQSPMISNGVAPPGGDIPLFYNPTIVDQLIQSDCTPQNSLNRLWA